MSLLRLRAELLLRRYGWLPPIALLLAMMSGWLAFVATAGLQQRADDYRRALQILVAEAKSVDSGHPPPHPLIQQRYAAFRDHLATKESLPGIVRILFSEARKADLTLQQVDYKLKEEKDDGYLVYSISVPIKGAYARIYQFAESVLVQLPAAALEDINFKRDNVEASTTEAQLQFAIYLRGKD